MRRAIAAALLAASLIPTAVRADEIASEANAVALLSAVDGYTTRRNMSTGPGAIEWNPIARPFVKSDSGAALYFATCALSVNVLARLLGRKSKGIARAYLAGNAALEVSAISWNVAHR